MTLFLRWLPLALIALAAFWLRTHDPERRPMHFDEANQAVKLGELLETGRYAFDPRDHHGPTLYYAALPIARLRGERTLAQLTETTIRLVPAIFGIASVVLLALLAMTWHRHPARAGVDWPALAAAVFLAVSPPAVYYSRYFIQETLLVTFTLAALVCARAWWRNGRLGWAIGAGVCVGLMQATKATAPLFVFAAVVACLASRSFLAPRSYESERVDPSTGVSESTRSRSWLRAGVLALLAALATAALLYSSFFTNLSGLRDAFAAYANAFTRFGGEAAPTGHEKPWWYYLRLFGWFRDGLVWHQLAFSALALTGLGIAICRSLLAGDFPGPRPPSVEPADYDRGRSRSQSPASRLLPWAAVYTVIIIAAFSAFSPKIYSPWQAIHFVPGMALLAGGALSAISRLRAGKFVAAAAAILVIATQYQQTVRVAFQRPADHRNPYAYVHSSPDVRKYRALAEAAIARAPDQPIRVIVEDEEYWPLPWYLRGLPRVGFWPAPPDDCDGALVITSATQADAVRAKLRGQYRESFLGLRPGFVCIVFTRE